MSNILRFLLLTPHTDSKHVLLKWVPHDACNHLRCLGVFRVRTLVTLAQERQVGVCVLRLVSKELLEVSLLTSLVIEEQLSEHLVKR